MSKSLWRLAVILLIAGLALAACGGIDPNLIICKNNPAAVKDGDPICRSNVEGGIGKDEVRVPKANLPDGHIGIGIPYKSDAPYVLLTTKGLQEGWAQSQVVVIPTTRQELRTDTDPEGQFCKVDKAPMCLGTIKGQFQFEKDGKVQLANYELSFIAEFDAVVNPATVNLWGSIDRSKKSTWEMFASNFHDVFRGDKLLNLGRHDPIADLGADTTRALVVEIYKQRIDEWKYSPLVKDVNITIKSLTLPGITDINANTNSGQGGASISNDSVAESQRAIKILDAEAYRKQAEAICGADQVMTQACVDHMRNFLGIVPPITYPIQPTAVPAP